MVKIAVVDDDDAVRLAMGSLIRSLGYGADVYASAAAFLSHGLQPAPNCLLLDVQMPTMSGPELHDELMSRGYRIPVVFMTAGPIDELQRRVLAGNALDVLRKPCSGDLIEDCLARALTVRPNGSDPRE